MEYPPTDQFCSLSELFNALGERQYKKVWDGLEIECPKRRRPANARFHLEVLAGKIEKAKEDGYEVEGKSLRDYLVSDFENPSFHDQTILNDIRSYIFDCANWPDPDSNEYEQQYNRYVRQHRIHQELLTCLSSGHIHAWLDRVDGKEPELIPHYAWNSRGGFEFSITKGIGRFHSNDFGLVKIYKPDVQEILNSKKNKPSKGLEKFRELENLTWSESEILFVSDDKLEISARGERARINFGEFGLLDNNKTCGPDGKSPPNQSCNILRKMANGVYRKRKHNPNEAKRISRLRTLLKINLGINNDPFNKELSPNFGLKDVAKERERAIEQRTKTVPHHDNTQHSSVDAHKSSNWPDDQSFDREEDDAQAFLDSVKSRE